MATYNASVLYTLLCMVYLVHSAKIWGGIKENSYDPVTEAEFSETTSGYNAAGTRYLYLYRLVEPGTVPTLTINSFKSLRRLEIDDISLESVPIFKDTPIESIVITGNKIKRLAANVFDGPRPRHLNLTGNQIANIADNAINTGAGFVLFACNKLTSFSQAWFQDPSLITIMIRHLFLDFNEIGQLTADMFAPREKTMWTLNIHHNKLTYLTEALFVKLKPDKVLLDGNPWQCQCLRDIERWLRELKLTRVYLTFRRDDPSCVVPGSFENVCVHAVDKKLEQLYVDGLSPPPECVKPCGPCLIGKYSPSLASFQYTPT